MTDREFTLEDKVSYCKHILENNTFSEWEIYYYRGEYGANPHAIESGIWNAVAEFIGFKLENMDSHDGKYWLKSILYPTS